MVAAVAVTWGVAGGRWGAVTPVESVAVEWEVAGEVVAVVMRLPWVGETEAGGWGEGTRRPWVAEAVVGGSGGDMRRQSEGGKLACAEDTPLPWGDKLAVGRVGSQGV